MADLKYIMFEDRDGVKYPVIFSNHLNHIDVARSLLTNGFSDKLPNVFAASAGFIHMMATDTFGDSESMGGLKSRPEDRQVINVYPYQHGINVGTDMGVEEMVGVKHVEHIIKALRDGKWD